MSRCLLLFILSFVRPMIASVIPPIITASGRGDSAAVAALLDSGADANTLSPDSETPLHVAAITGDPATVQLLLDRGASPNVRAPSGVQRSMTPLHWASYGGHGEMVRLLLEHGADAGAVDETGMTAVDMAREAGHLLVVELLEKGAGEL